MHRRRSVFYGSITRAPTNGPETADRSGKRLPYTFTKPPAKNYTHNVVQNNNWPTTRRIRRRRRRRRSLATRGFSHSETAGNSHKNHNKPANKCKVWKKSRQETRTKLNGNEKAGTRAHTHIYTQTPSSSSQAANKPVFANKTPNTNRLGTQKERRLARSVAPNKPPLQQQPPNYPQFFFLRN